MPATIAKKFENIPYVTDQAMIGDHPYPSFEAHILLRFLSGWQAPERIAQLLEDVGLSQSDLQTPFIPACKMLALFDYARKTLPARASGCRIGYSFQLDDLGELATALKQCTDLQQGFNAVNQYSQLFGSYSDSYREVKDGLLTVQHINVNKIPAPLMQFILEVGFCSHLSLASELVGQPVKLEKVCFTVDADDETRRVYSQVLDCEVEFNAAVNSWSTRLETLALPVLEEHARGMQSAQHLCEQLLRQASEQPSLTTDIIQILSSSEGDYPDLQLIADALNISTRTLRRKLGEFDVNYQSLLNQVRCRLAIGKISNSKRSAEDIADELGYSDVANFRNAFKRWLGLTPGQIAEILN